MSVAMPPSNMLTHDKRDLSENEGETIDNTKQGYFESILLSKPQTNS